MSDLLEQYTKLTAEEEWASEAMYQDYKDKNALTDEQILEGVFHGDASRVQQRMKELDDIHVKTMPGGKFQVSRYSEEREQHENELLNELKKENEQLRHDFVELKNLIIEKLK